MLIVLLLYCEIKWIPKSEESLHLRNKSVFNYWITLRKHIGLAYTIHQRNLLPFQTSSAIPLSFSLSFLVDNQLDVDNGYIFTSTFSLLSNKRFSDERKKRDCTHAKSVCTSCDSHAIIIRHSLSFPSFLFSSTTRGLT